MLQLLQFDWLVCPWNKWTTGSVCRQRNYFCYYFWMIKWYITYRFNRYIFLYIQNDYFKGLCMIDKMTAESYAIISVRQLGMTRPISQSSWAHNWNLLKSLCCNYDSNDPMKSRIWMSWELNCHDMKNCNLMGSLLYKKKPYDFLWFGSWANEPFVK